MTNSKMQNLAVKYAIALLKAFDLRAKDAVAISFNAGDLYEIITGKSSGVGLVSLDDIEKATQDPKSVDPKDWDKHAAAADRILKSVPHYKLSMKAMSGFMEEVEDCLTSTDLVEEYGCRDLIIKQFDGGQWLAIDVSKITPVAIDF